MLKTKTIFPNFETKKRFPLPPQSGASGADRCAVARFLEVVLNHELINSLINCSVGGGRGRFNLTDDQEHAQRNLRSTLTRYNVPQPFLIGLSVNDTSFVCPISHGWYAVDHFGMG